MAYAKRRTYAPRTVTVPTRTPVAPSYAPSPYQQAILDAVTTTSSNLLIQARAGSGKTSTLVMLANALPRNASACFLAFNRAIADELSTRLPSHVAASTFHSLGYRAVRSALNIKTKPDAQKVARIFDDTLGRDYASVRAAVLKLVSLLKASAILPDDAPPSELSAIISHFDVTWDDDNFSEADICRLALQILAANNADTSVVDFDDMLYFVVAFDISLQTFDYVMVDESQDTNEIQREMLRRLLGPRSRLIAVGDEAQAIYGFRGASSDSMHLIASEFRCTPLPLSISYRCPRTVIELAQEYVPDIQARDNAPEGTILYPRTWALEAFAPTDLVICRNTAPLVRVAYRMIAARIPCKILGREIGKGLTSLITKLSGKRGTLETLPDLLEAYRTKEVGAALNKRLEGKAQAINDKVDSILALLDSLSPDDASRGIAGLIAIIDEMFDDKASNVTTLSTIHKAKGREAHRVFIVDAYLMPSKFAKQEWQLQQEHNLAYVAITRSLDTLIYLDSKTVGDDSADY